jgi:hypothetical protein
MPKKSFPCIECKKNVENQHSINCCVCQRWVHKDCIDETIYKLVIEIHEKHGAHFWSCDGCSRGLSGIQKIVAAQDAKINELRKDVDVVKNDVDCVKKDVKENKESQNKVIDRVETVEKLVDNMKSTNEHDIYKELDERAAKQSNLIIFDIPEQSADLTPSERKDEDIRIVLQVIKATGFKNASEQSLKFVVRIGERKDGQARPTCIGFREQADRDRVLRNGKNIATNFPNYFLAPDLTKIQLARDKDVRNEATKKNAELNEDEAKNFAWKVVGPGGQKRLMKVKKIETGEAPTARTRLTSTKRTAAEMEDVAIADQNPPTQTVETRTTKVRKQHQT